MESSQLCANESLGRGAHPTAISAAPRTETDAQEQSFEYYRPPIDTISTDHDRAEVDSPSLTYPEVQLPSSPELRKELKAILSKRSWTSPTPDSACSNATDGFRQQFSTAFLSSSASPSVPSVPVVRPMVTDPNEGQASDDDIFSTLWKDLNWPRPPAPEREILEHAGIAEFMGCFVCGKAFGELKFITFKNRSVIHSSCLQGWIKMSKDVRRAIISEPLLLCSTICYRIDFCEKKEDIYESEVCQALLKETSKWLKSTNMLWSKYISRLDSEL